MLAFRVEQIATGIVLFEGDAPDENTALDRMAETAGYASFAAIPPEVGGGDTIRVTPLVMRAAA